MPRWIGKLFPHQSRMTWTGEIVRPNVKPLRFDLKPFSQQVNAVCEKCNNGWMNDLEKDVQPFLGPMLTASAKTRLRPIRQRLLAAWAVKTAFMFQQLHPKNAIIPGSEYERFYLVKTRPPIGYVVWIAHRKSMHHSAGTELFIESHEEMIPTFNLHDEALRESVEQEVENGAVIFRATFAISNVVFVVFGHNFTKSGFEIGVTRSPGFYAEPTRWIWPVQGQTWWPPRDSVERIGGVQALHNAFNPRPQ